MQTQSSINCFKEKNTKTIVENYRYISDNKYSFDIHFWQSQGPLSIFKAVTEMLYDYFLIRGKDVNEFRLQRTVESFQKI